MLLGADQVWAADAFAYFSWSGKLRMALDLGALAVVERMKPPFVRRRLALKS
jgi:hypothetical protein